MSLHPAIQNSVLAAIAQPDFSAALPPLSDAGWLRILNTSHHAMQENDKLEFLGDAMMYAALGDQLYRQLPQGSPGLYTNARQALHSNLTFSRLAEKLDIFAVSDIVLKALTARTFGEGTSAPGKTKLNIKATADMFETVIGLYYLERGYTALCKWVDELYSPLVTAASQTYNDHMHRRHLKAVKKNFKVHLTTKHVANRQPKPVVLRHTLSKKPILVSSSSSSRSSLARHRGISPRGTFVGSSHHCAGVATMSKTCISHDGKASSSATKARASPTIIDLTTLDDSEAESSPKPTRPISNPRLGLASAQPPQPRTLAKLSDDEMQGVEGEISLEKMLTRAADILRSMDNVDRV